ncbi:MAG: helix-turn-helix transcriptional regulator [Bacillota bacterium]
MKEKQRRLGARLRALRRSRNLSQEQLAERTGIHPTYLTKIELGMRLPSLEVLSRLAVALSTSVASIVQAMDQPHGSSPQREAEFLLQGLSPGQTSLTRDFIELIRRYNIGGK